MEGRLIANHKKTLGLITLFVINLFQRIERYIYMYNFKQVEEYVK